MKHEYFNTKEIYEKAEAEGNYDLGDVLVSYPDSGFTHRWIQPPVACYFVSSLDPDGNTNVAPISMGTAMWGEPPDSGWYYSFNVHNRRNTRHNLMNSDECVICYYGSELMKESWITGLALPLGISELDVAKLTPLASVQVEPFGIKECPVNLECKIVNRIAISNNTLFITKVVGAHVDESYKKADMANPFEPGVAGIDLLFETSITGTPPRLNYLKMDLNNYLRTDETLGDSKHWIGTFQTWMLSELERGRIDRSEYKELIDLNDQWMKNRNPIDNGEVKEKLTRKLKEICWREI